MCDNFICIQTNDQNIYMVLYLGDSGPINYILVDVLCVVLIHTKNLDCNSVLFQFDALWSCCIYYPENGQHFGLS